MKKKLLIVAVLAALVALVACTAGQSGSSAESGHPALSEQDKLVACRDCHQQTTPKVYQEWFDNTHGLGNVRCFQCHGTFENLKKTPDLLSCNACHADKMGDHRSGMNCWECHSAHSFAAK